MNYRSGNTERRTGEPGIVFGVSLVVCMSVLSIVLTGCGQVDPRQGYTNRSLYRTDVKTVCVEMFDSESFRRGIEYDLTRAVVGQLELHTPYKVISDRRKADSILYGTVRRVAERRLVRQRELDRSLANEVEVIVEFSWKDLRSGKFLIEEQQVRASGDYVSLLGAGRKSAAREAANDIAIRIVESLEKEW